jgi:hypothetical protein
MAHQHIIIILKDGTHLCTCLLLVSRRIICHHYFKLIVENPNALFHMILMQQDGFEMNHGVILKIRLLEYHLKKVRMMIHKKKFFF